MTSQVPPRSSKMAAHTHEEFLDVTLDSMETLAESSKNYNNDG